MTPRDGPDEGEEGAGTAARRPSPRARLVTAIRPGKSGVSELHLECGHVLRRRLSLCPPSKVICPYC
jgi:hypothetical protein